MGYIQKDNVAYVSAKLTDYGRRQLAIGQLNFSYWGFGDSEIDYGSFDNTYSWSDIVDLGNLEILRPSDNPAGVKYPLLRIAGNSGSTYSPVNNVNLNETVINNQALERGFFTGTTKAATTFPERKYDYSLRTATTFTKAVGKTNLRSIVRAGSNLTQSLTPGSTGIDINKGQFGSITDVSVNAVEPIAGDFMVLVPNEFQGPTTGTIPGPGPGHVDSAYPLPYLWYRIDEVTGTLAANSLKVTVDRSIPNFTGSTTTQYRDSSVFFYQGNDPINTYYGTGTTIPYWNELSLTFDSNCDVSVTDVKVWNMNIPWTQTVAGLTASTHGDYATFGSTGYTGTKEYLNYTVPTDSESYGGLVEDYRQKSIAVIHYSNNSISNFYGEGFYWNADGTNNFELTMPTVMYNYTGNTTMGLLLTGETRTTPRTITSTYNSNSEIDYYQLHTSGGTSGILSPSYTKPKSVGKIFPELKMAVIDDEEIVAALSYKSNRNWTLPSLEASYYTPSGSTSLMSSGDQLVISYLFTSTSGYTTGLHCNQYTILSETSTNCSDCDGNGKNVKVKFPYGSLPFMRRGGISSTLGTPGADNDANTKFIGWDATSFDIIVQKVQNNEQPDPQAWRRIPVAQNAVGTSIYNTHNGKNWVDYEVLYDSEFIITNEYYDSTTGTYAPDGGNYSICDWISMPTLTELTTSPNLPGGDANTTLTFGDERFFFGNVDTNIKATVFRSTFSFTAGAGEFNTSQNPTFATGAAVPSHNVRVAEVAVYDSNYKEVIMGKISNPIEKSFGDQFTLVMGLDF
jgi:hypothetical protein|tara:strand:+ start:26657 stop:29038 length:2382 start_codon:yes stop_codon:yes gene_type:complete